MEDANGLSLMTHKEWLLFFVELNKINCRDCLIAKIMLQGVKRIGDVLSLMVDHIDFNTRQITFNQKKSNCLKQTFISYPQEIMDQLKTYLGDRSGNVFITSGNKRMLPYQLNITFLKAGQRAGIPFKVTPKVLRATVVKYLSEQGFGSSEDNENNWSCFDSDCICIRSKRLHS